MCGGGGDEQYSFLDEQIGDIEQNENEPLLKKGYFKVLLDDGKVVLSKQIARLKEGTYTFCYSLENVDITRVRTVYFYGYLERIMKVILREGRELVIDSNSVNDDIFVSLWFNLNLKVQEEYRLTVMYEDIDVTECADILCDTLRQRVSGEEEEILRERNLLNEKRENELCKAELADTKKYVEKLSAELEEARIENSKVGQPRQNIKESIARKAIKLARAVADIVKGR